MHKTENIDDGYLGSGLVLEKAIKKYGKEKFVREILSFWNSYDELREAEKNILTKTFILDNKHKIYNIEEGGKGYHLKSHSDETKRLIKEKRKEQICTYETRQKMSVAQKKKWEKQKKSGWQSPARGKKRPKHTQETKDKRQRTLMLLNIPNPTIGRKYVSNISLNCEKRVKFEDIDIYLKAGYVVGRLPRHKEWLINISKSQKGRTFSKETKEKMSIAKIGHKSSEETKEKMRLTQKKRWEKRRQNEFYN